MEKKKAAIEIMIMYKIGGVYLDLDYEMLVVISQEVKSSIKQGLVILLGICKEDSFSRFPFASEPPEYPTALCI